MKKQLLLMAVISFFLYSCNKGTDIVNNNNNNNSSAYYVKFKFDGTEIKYTYATGNLNIVTSSGEYSSFATGIKSDLVSNKNSLSVFVTTSNPSVANTTYTNYQTSAAGYIRAPLCAIGMKDNNGNFFGSWGDEFASFGVTSDTKVKFTEITSSELRGTFSGTVYKEINGTSEKHLITDGEFFVNR